ncbi:MAG: hypothetical protein M1347_04755 [Chloroflexi bacterium]|nr:hypothetical protein [Chloroflexota bacterium]
MQLSPRRDLGGLQRFSGIQRFAVCQVDQLIIELLGEIEAVCKDEGQFADGQILMKQLGEAVPARITYGNGDLCHRSSSHFDFRIGPLAILIPSPYNPPHN